MSRAVLDIPMRCALELAAQARAICPPNPAVGCVIVNDLGIVLGQGHTQAVGQAHAEIMALRDAAARGHSVVGATAFVTLEPCSHHGRTGPCCDALIESGIGRVIASVEDPNPMVAGRGFARLRAAGIDVVVGPGAEQSRELNIGFFNRMQYGKPWLRMKAASSLDGRTALPNGTSQWITSELARADGHRWRARACAVLTGIGTVLADDPRLDVRLVATPRQPALAIIDSRLQTPLSARLWQPSRSVWIYTAELDTERYKPLLARGAEVIATPGPLAQVDLSAVIRDLAQRQCSEVHIEAGARLNAALLRARLVDELLLYQAPLLLGEGHGIATLGSFDTLSKGVHMEIKEIERVGPDLRCLARVVI